MKVTNAKVFILKDDGKSKTKAYATIEIDGSLEIEGFKVISGANGLFVGWPSRQDPKTKEWPKTVTTSDKEFYKEVEKFVVNAYKAELGNATTGTTTRPTTSSKPSAAQGNDDNDDIFS